MAKASFYDRVAKHLRYQDLDYCSHYGEPGYTDPEAGILFANWNDCPRRIQDFLESKGFELEWSDEWIIDHNSDKAYRTSPDCYHWKPSYVLTDDCDIIGQDDLEDYVEDYIAIYLNAADRVATFDNFDPAAHGFTKYNGTYESGWHPGQTDDPSKVAELLGEIYPDHDYLFTIDEVSQFYTKWLAWIRPRDYEEALDAA